jgi:GNAT superfamily N-acetyltransferase
VFVFVRGGEIIGYHSIVTLERDIEVSGIRLEKGHWLEHMFFSPKYIGQGVGRTMFDHVRKRCEVRGVAHLSILADPNSRQFYERMGCRYEREFPSTIKHRTTPLLSLTIEGR